MLPRSFKELMRSEKTSAGATNKQQVVTPLVMQMHITECGAACLGSILAWFGRWVHLNELRNLCEVSRDGSTAAGVSRAARHYGLKCSGRSVNAEHLRGMPLPQVLFWELNHFLILEGFDGNSVLVNDPAIGRRRLSWQEFVDGFSGISLYFSPTPEFRPGGISPSILERIRPWLEGTWVALAFTVACGLMMAVLGLSLPISLNLFVDRAFSGQGLYGGYAAGALFVTGLLVFWLCWIMQRCMRRLAVRMSIIAGDRFLTRLLRLPLTFFNHRLVGELTDRILSVDRVAKGLAKNFLNLVVEVAMGAVFLAALFAYDVKLALIVLVLALPNVALAHAISRMRVDEHSMLRREQGLLFGLGMLMLRQSDTLRMTASDDGFFSRWSGHQAREVAVRRRFNELGHINAALPGLFTLLAQTAVLAIGAGEVIAGDMTLGALVASFVLASMFLAPVGRLVDFASERQALLIGLQRLDDISKTKVDGRFSRNSAETGSRAAVTGRLRLAGRVELRNVTFGYDRGRPPLIKDFNLLIEPGQRVAVVGASGSGKSTLASLVSGATEPWSGDILFDGCLRHEVPDAMMTRSLSIVDQSPILFSGTVRENVTLWNSAVPDEILVAAARDACIHDRIVDRPLGYATQVEEEGSNFSGGERQRLEIARALVGNPTVLILDEATSALDAKTEKAVDDALRRRGISCLIVAHRLSTIRDCDQIVALDRGKEVQRGTHDELMADPGGLYHRLLCEG